MCIKIGQELQYSQWNDYNHKTSMTGRIRAKIPMFRARILTLFASEGYNMRIPVFEGKGQNPNVYKNRTRIPTFRWIS